MKPTNSSVKDVIASWRRRAMRSSKAKKKRVLLCFRRVRRVLSNGEDPWASEDGNMDWDSTFMYFSKTIRIHICWPAGLLRKTADMPPSLSSTGRWRVFLVSVRGSTGRDGEYGSALFSSFMRFLGCSVFLILFVYYNKNYQRCTIKVSSLSSLRFSGRIGICMWFWAICNFSFAASIQ